MEFVAQIGVGVELEYREIIIQPIGPVNDRHLRDRVLTAEEDHEVATLRDLTVAAAQLS